MTSNVFSQSVGKGSETMVGVVIRSQFSGKALFHQQFIDLTWVGFLTPTIWKPENVLSIIYTSVEMKSKLGYNTVHSKRDCSFPKVESKL